MSTLNSSKILAILASLPLLQACGASDETAKETIISDVSTEKSSENVSEIYQKSNYINESVNADNLTGLWMSVIELDESSDDDDAVSYSGTLYQRSTLSITQETNEAETFQLYHCYGDNPYEAQEVAVDEDGQFIIEYSVTDKVNSFDEDEADNIDEEVTYIIKGEVTENVLITATMYIKISDGDNEEEIETGMASWVKYANTPSIPGDEYTNIGTVTGSINNDVEDETGEEVLTDFNAYCMRQSSLEVDASFTYSENGEDLLSMDGTYSDSTLYVVALDNSDIENSQQVLLDATHSSFESTAQLNEGGPSLPGNHEASGESAASISITTAMVIYQDIDKETSIAESAGENNTVVITASIEDFDDIDETSCNAEQSECTEFNLDQADDSDESLQVLSGSLISIEKEEDDNLAMANDTLGRADVEFNLELAQE